MKSFTALLQLASILAATALAVPTADPNTVSKRQSKRNPVTVTFYDNKNQQDALPGCKQKVADARICSKSACQAALSRTDCSVQLSKSNIHS